MSIINKFVSSFNNLGDEYDDEYLDEYYEDEYDEYEDKKSNKVNFFKPNKSRKSRYDEYDEPAQTSAPRRSNAPGVCVVKPTSLEDGREICETLLENRTVILNLEGVDLEIAQRIIDFTSGAAYSMQGKLQKITEAIFLVTPSSVEITGDLQDLLGAGSFDVSSIRNRY